jgi:adenosylmethionine-8-amino-7-oxononanoate aminotransferase
MRGDAKSSLWLILRGQGVQEVLKGASKDAYTLRFATEKQAQEWRKAFDLISKVRRTRQFL